MACLRNSQADLEIGITSFGAYKQPALYVKEGNRKRTLAQFFSEDAAARFLKLLERWDENGGSDEKHTD